MKTASLSALLLAVGLIVSPDAQATDYSYIGASGGNWSAPANWTPAGDPNAIGDIARYTGTSGAKTVIQDISGGVTVGQIISSGNTSFTITNTNGITLNNGGGAGALISATSATVGTYSLSVSTGTLTLGDNLRLTNSSGSTATGGSIQIGSIIGGVGAIFFNNTTNSLAASQIMLSGSNTFTGSSFIQSGAVAYNTSSAFGQSANTINLGSTGGGSTTLYSTTGALNVPNNIVVTAGTNGTATLGSNSAAATGGTYSGTITMNNDLVVTSAFPTVALKFTNSLSGAGALTKNGAGIASLTNSNSYSGGTLINLGTLQATHDGALGSGNVSLTAASVTLNLSGGTTNNYIADTATLSLFDATDRVGLAFTGAPDVIGQLIIGGVAQAPGTYGATGSGALFTLPEFTGSGTINNLGLAAIPEPSTYAMMFLGVGMLVGMQLLRRRRA